MSNSEPSNQSEATNNSVDPDQDQTEPEKKESQTPEWVKRLGFMYMWYWPLSPLRVGYTTAEDELENRIELKERRLSARLRLFILFNVIQSFFLALAFTWPLTLSPLIDLLAGLVPSIVWEIVEAVADAIQEMLSPLDPVISFLQDLSKIFNTLNPGFAFAAGWWLGSRIRKELSDDENYEEVKVDSDIGTNGFLQEFGKKAFGISSGLSPWFVFFFMQFATFLFLIRRAKNLIYELQSDKETESREKRIKERLPEDMQEKAEFVRTGKRWGNEKKWRFLPEFLVALSQGALFAIPLVLVLFGILPFVK
ncbi:MAG: hypothetical protein ACXAEI_10455 [Candidatus Hodarchaeales archaeon]|jgi:hypothetical protein